MIIIFDGYEAAGGGEQNICGIRTRPVAAARISGSEIRGSDGGSNQQGSEDQGARSQNIPFYTTQRLLLIIFLA